MEESSHSSPVRILVVDDEPDLEPLIRQKFRRQLRNDEVEFVFASDGVHALNKLAEDDEIDVVLTDINMPRMDGLTLLSRLAQLDTTLKAIVVTAYGDMVNIRTAMNRGAFDFLTKPIDLSDLEITLEKAVAESVRQRRLSKARDVFGRYISDEVAEQLLTRSGALQMGGEKRTITVLVSDLRGFSSLAERIPAEKVVEMLNIYFGAMVDVVGRHKGTIDEFIGDGMLVLFGAPIAREDDAKRAIACALEMQQEMRPVNEVLVARDLPALEMGIGVNTGDAIVGNIGSEKRTKYSAVGSNVNLASRIESFSVGRQVLVSEATLKSADLDVSTAGEFELAAKGFLKPVLVHDVIGVGAPFNLSLPKRSDELLNLDVPWPVQYAKLDGKHVTETLGSGEVISVSCSGAVIRTLPVPAVFENLKLVLGDPDDPAEIVGDIYAKVVGSSDDSLAQVRFTAVPEEVLHRIKSLQPD